MKRTARPVIHVTESFGGGVATAIKDYCRNYPDVEHHLIYSPREDAPLSPTDLEGFVTVGQLPESHLGRIRVLREFLSAHRDAIIHAHSSYAGAYVRATIRKSRRRPIVYTPHCYGFERLDVSKGRRAIFWLLEWLFAFNTNVFAGCSSREVGLSEWPLVSARRVLVPNVPASDLDQDLKPRKPQGKMAVVGAGRLSPQKDPAFFRDCVDQLRNSGLDIDARWIGGGDPEMETMLEEGGITLTGWLPRAEALGHLKTADLYIHTALWEGFPLAVLEASILNVPTLVRDIDAFEDIPAELKVETGLARVIADWSEAPEGSAGWGLRNLDLWKTELIQNHDTIQAESLQTAYSV